MYGVPADLDLSPFVGLTLTNIGIGPFDLRLDFSAPPKADRGIGISAKWELRASDGEIIDRGGESNSDRDGPFQFQQIIGHDVSGHALSAPDWIELQFDNGLRFRVYDDSEQYESFSLQPGDIYV